MSEGWYTAFAAAAAAAAAAAGYYRLKLVFVRALSHLFNGKSENEWGMSDPV